MTTIFEPAYAKLNLTLDVLGKREDGYHNLKSVMQTVSLHDILTVTKAETVSMTCSDPTLSCGEDNLCLKAARAFFAAYGPGGCHIHLEKNLPREAGMGGGSADGAAVLRALNRLYGHPYSPESLCALGAGIGADVPFCVLGRGAALAEGIGEQLSSFPSLPPCYLVIASGAKGVSTPEAYHLLDTLPPKETGSFDTFAAAMKEGDLTAIGHALYNRFEDVTPSCRPVIELFEQNGACGARMTGSGSAVFGLFRDPETAGKACQILRKASYTATLQTPIGSHTLS